MKTLFVLTLLLSPIAARADDISIGCNSDKIVFGSDDVSVGKDSSPALTVNKKEIEGIRVIFRSDEKHWTYIVTEPEGENYKQYHFTVARGCGGDGKQGEVTVHTVGKDKKTDKTYDCTCDTD